MGGTDGTGREGDGVSRPTRNADGAWSGVYVLCADGKQRRIEPGLAPLVAGVPGRVDELKAYGNAIVPELAATFLEAVKGTLGIV